MPDTSAKRSLTFDRATLEVERALRTSLGFAPARLTTAEIRSTYPTRRFVRGWRVRSTFTDGEERRIDVLLPPFFPAGFPRTALVDRPEHMTWPHVERDGVLCLLPVMAEVDSEDPGAVAVQLLGRSARLAEELLAGDIVDRDFREEFLTYWFYGSDGDAPRVISIVSPDGGTRLVRAWRDGKGLVAVGEDDASLARWLRNLRGEPDAKSYRTEAAALIRLPAPPVPAQYPSTGADLFAMALAAGGDAQATLERAAAMLPDDLLVLLAADGRAGAGLVAVTTTSARPSRGRSGRIERPVTKGFREIGMTRGIASMRTFSTAPLLRSVVARADPQWIHGRGRDSRVAKLLGSTVAVIGCGSVGSSVAMRLARAGTGTLHLVDHDNLAWSNLGRHELGAGSVGRNKATELAARIRADLSHLDATGHAMAAETLTARYGELLGGCDLVVAATGSWGADGAVNRWHVRQGRDIPVVYGWAESHATAGHAVTIAAAGGCLRCGVGPTGVPAMTATTWPEGGATLEEPACGNHFQPYGAVELGFVVDLIAQTALDALLSPPATSQHAIWLGAGDRLHAAGGAWSPDAIALGAGQHQRTAGRDWPSADCPACRATHERRAA